MQRGFQGGVEEVSRRVPIGSVGGGAERVLRGSRRVLREFREGSWGGREGAEGIPIGFPRRSRGGFQWGSEEVRRGLEAIPRGCQGGPEGVPRGSEGF